ncbi:MAG: hypothetical protein ICV68_00030 [Pyrinomonadaceae bacterium]|nr:hypothetical protein [Pyrinomonadaceae bacterium]
MKRCPTCQRTYTDESLTFCLEDGAPLLSEPSSSVSADEPPATMILSEPPITSSNRNAAPTEVYNANATQGSTTPPAGQSSSSSYGHTTPPPSWTPQPSAPHSQPFGQTAWPAATSGAPPNKFVLGILGGVVMALPSLIPLVQWICCIWAAAGGLLAAAMYIKKSPTKVEMGEAAILGAIAGGVGGLINLLAGLPIAYALYGPAGPYTTQDGSIGGVLVVVGIFGSLMLVAFAVVGGLLAVPLFEKRKSGPNAQPPYGGAAGGYR